LNILKFINLILLIMRKVLFSKIVMFLAIVSLAVGCKDYDDDIDDLTKQLTEL